MRAQKTKQNILQRNNYLKYINQILGIDNQVFKYRIIFNIFFKAASKKKLKYKHKGQTCKQK